jgi:hypothetical protein
MNKKPRIAIPPPRSELPPLPDEPVLDGTVLPAVPPDGVLLLELPLEPLVSPLELPLLLRPLLRLLLE